MEQLSTFVMNNWILFAALLVVIALLIKSYISGFGIKNVRPLEAVELINHKDAVVLDVRVDDEFKDGHILNSLHIPVGLLKGRIQELEKYRAQPIVVSCRSGQRAAQACSILRSQGFESIFKLEGGLMAWQNANLPLSQK